VGVRSVEDHFSQSIWEYFSDLFECVSTILIRNDIDFTVIFFFNLFNGFEIPFAIDDVHKDHFLIFRIKFEYLLIDIHDRNVVDGVVLDLHIVFWPKEFDEPRCSYHHY